MVILENIDIDIDKEILENIKSDKISNRLEFGIWNRATLSCLPASVIVFCGANSIKRYHVCRGGAPMLVLTGGSSQGNFLDFFPLEGTPAPM